MIGEKPIDKQTVKQKFSKSPLYGYRKPEIEETGGPLWCRCTIPYLTSTMGIGAGMAHCMRCGYNYYH